MVFLEARSHAIRTGPPSGRSLGPEAGTPCYRKIKSRPLRVELGPLRADGRRPPQKEHPMSKGNREVRKPKTIKPKVIAAAPSTLSQTLAPRKK